MRKIVLIISSLLILCAVTVYVIEYKKPYKKAETIYFSDFLFEEPTKENCQSLKLNRRGDVVFDNKVIVLKNGIPLNKKSATEHDEIKTYLIALGREKLDCRERSFDKDFYYTDLRKEYSGKYKPEETITLNEYLDEDKTDKDWETLKLNENDDVIFKDKVIMTEAGVPLNEKTVYTNLEFKIYFAAAGIKPREGCDPNDTANNGVLGCYMDNPDE